jgi:hypothetical protein
MESMYVPTDGWHGEQKTGASVGAASMAAGCSTLAASQRSPVLTGAIGDGNVAVAVAPDGGVAAHAASIHAVASTASERTGPICRIRLCLRYERNLPTRSEDRS